MAAGTGRWKGRVARAGFVAAGVFAGLVIAEVTLRIVAPQTLGLRWYTREAVMVHVPGLRATYVRPEYRTPVAIDSDGLRDREYALGKPSGVYRILLLGDSYAEALQVPAEQSFPKLTEERLRTARPGARIEIVNAGVAGYGTADELRYLEAFGKRWQPDLVLLAFYSGNDVRNNLDEEGMRREGGTLQVSRKPLTSWQYHVRGLRNWLAAHSHLWQFVRARFTSRDESPRKGAGKRAAARDRKSAAGADPHSDRTPSEGAPSSSDSPSDVIPWSRRPFADTDDSEVVRPEPGPDFVRGWLLTHELISRIDETSRALGARLAVVVVPGPWQSDPKFLAAKVGEERLRDGTYDPAWPGRKICGMAAELAAPCLDLQPAFRAAGADASFYWKIDSHFTPKAHEVAARELARFLSDSVIPPSAGE